MSPRPPPSTKPASRYDVLDVETAACRLGLGLTAGRRFLERHGLVRRVGANEWVPWGAVYDFISGVGADPASATRAPGSNPRPPEVLTVREAVAMLRMRDRPARTWLREQGLLIHIGDRERVLRAALLSALTPPRSEPRRGTAHHPQRPAASYRYRVSDAF